MDLETFIGATSCLSDDALATVLAGQRLRQRGPQPILADSEVLTIEVVGECLGLDQDPALSDHFRRHHADLFPALPTIHRTTFVRQAANLWRITERIWQLMLGRYRTIRSWIWSIVSRFRSVALPARIAVGCSGATPPSAATNSIASRPMAFAAMDAVAGQA